MNITAYRFTDSFDFNAIDLNKFAEQLAEHAFTVCGAQQTASIGWIAPALPDALYYHNDSLVVLTMKRQERLLPSAVVTDAVNAQVEQIKQDEGRKISRKERLELKEKVTAELLPKAFTTSKQFDVMIDITGGRLYVFATPSRADEVTELLRTTLGSLPIVPVGKDFHLGAELTQWLVNGFPAGINQKSKLRLSQQKETAQFSDADLFESEITQLVADGAVVEHLELGYDDLLTCVVDESFNLKSVKFDDSVYERAYDLAGNEAGEAEELLPALTRQANFILQHEAIKRFFSALMAQA